MTERMSDERLARYEHEILEGRYGEDDDLDALIAEVRRAREAESALRDAVESQKQMVDYHCGLQGSIAAERDALRDQLKRYGHTPGVVK